MSEDTYIGMNNIIDDNINDNDNINENVNDVNDINDINDINDNNVNENKKLLNKFKKGMGMHRQYLDILVYNELKTNDQTPNNKLLNTSLTDLMTIYDRLYNYGFSLAGYQFIGLAVSSFSDDISFLNQFAFFILSIGFIISCFSSLLSFCMYEYINGIKLETNEFIVSGLSFYRVYLFIPHPLLLFNTLLFIIPFNILMHTSLGYKFAMWMNIISVILCSGFWIHMRMIFFEQKYPSIINNGTIIKRRINSNT